MTETPTTIDLDNEVETLADIVREACKPEPLDDDGHLLGYVVPAGGKVHVVDVRDHLEHHLERPARKTGSFKVLDAASFVAYLGKHATDDTEVWVDDLGQRVVGVVNAHAAEQDLAGHGDHTVTLAVAKTDAWQAWAQHDGRLLDQETFAELIETRAVDIVSPTSADMLELAQSFHATIGVAFESSKLLSSGERQLEYREQIDAKAGRAGNMTIPQVFKLALKPFEGGAVYGVTARFRYRIQGGTLRVGYQIERPEDVLREAFDSVTEAIREGVWAPVYRGRTA